MLKYLEEIMYNIHYILIMELKMHFINHLLYKLDFILILNNRYQNMLNQLKNLILHHNNRFY